MSSVTPVPQQSAISIYSGVPWDDTYSDIRYFENNASRENYLEVKRKGLWTGCSVVSSNKIRVEAKINNVVDCNYMSFTNIGFDTPRTFYCFITSVDYINVNTVEITYEIDWVQSYLYDIRFESCNIEREHVSDDTWGKNTAEENLDIGEYVIESQRRKVYSPSYIIFYLDDSNEASIVNNVVTGLQSISSSSGDLNIINNLLSNFNNTPEKIVYMSMCYNGDYSMHDTFTLTHESTAFEWQGDFYNPVNNKLQMYPYKLFTVDNFSGDVEQYRWEDFNSKGDFTFAVEGSKIPKPCLETFPINYKGVKASDTEVNTVQQLSVKFDNFPTIPWSSDTFKAWISQYQSYGWRSDAASVATSIASMGFGGGIGAVSGIMGIGNTFMHRYMEYKEHQLHSSQSHGSIGSSGLNFSRGEIGFRFTQYSIKPEYARKIDKYFTRYGYKVDTVKIPNVRGRRYFNYVKCYEAHCDGEIPIDAKKVIENALTAGVTFWHTNDIGKVFNDNPIV